MDTMQIATKADEVKIGQRDESFATVDTVRGGRVLRAIVDGIPGIVAWIRKNRRIRLTGEVVKVNLGCGLSVADGWVHVDAGFKTLLRHHLWLLRLFYSMSESREWYTEKEFLDALTKHQFVHHKLEYGLPFCDDSIDYIYSSHFLEHLYKDEGERLVFEIYRVLKKGGRVRITVPDLRHVVDLYLQGQRGKALSFAFVTSQPRSRYSRHQYLYDFELLRDLLAKAGFAEIERCQYRRGSVPDIERLDNRPDQTLYVEAIKPRPIVTLVRDDRTHGHH
jgi:predicted SAM-dependent methyltransferase